MFAVDGFEKGGFLTEAEAAPGSAMAESVAAPEASSSRISLSCRGEDLAEVAEAVEKVDGGRKVDVACPASMVATATADASLGQSVREAGAAVRPGRRWLREGLVGSNSDEEPDWGRGWAGDLATPS